jgi:hypothetical protein
MSSTTYPRHIGLERILNGSSAAVHTLHAVTKKKYLGKGAIAVGIIAAVTYVGRQVDLGNDGFLAQWIAQCLIAGMAFWLLSLVVWPVIALGVRTVKSVMNYLRVKAQEDAFYAAALADPRLMRDLQAAKTRAE